MKRKLILIALALIACALVTMSGNTAPASAKPADAYTIDWYTMDGGGAMFSTGGTYSLGGTIGQADAGTMSGGTYNLNSGFWNGIGNLLNFYLPMILK
jgi:hypothetical protein